MSGRVPLARRALGAPVHALSQSASQTEGMLPVWALREGAELVPSAPAQGVLSMRLPLDLAGATGSKRRVGSGMERKEERQGWLGPSGMKEEETPFAGSQGVGRLSRSLDEATGTPV